MLLSFTPLTCWSCFHLLCFLSCPLVLTSAIKSRSYGRFSPYGRFSLLRGITPHKLLKGRPRVLLQCPSWLLLPFVMGWEELEWNQCFRSGIVPVKMRWTRSCGEFCFYPRAFSKCGLTASKHWFVLLILTINPSVGGDWAVQCFEHIPGVTMT
jgi:hypothetical protein